MKFNFNLRIVLIALVAPFACLTATAQDVKLSDIECEVEGKYVEVSVDAMASKAKSKSIEIEVTFYDKNKKAITTKTKSYSNKSGKLSVSKTIRPNNDLKQYDDITLKVPLTQFSDYSSHETLYYKFDVTIGGKSVGSNKSYYSFKLYDDDDDDRNKNKNKNNNNNNNKR